MAGETLLQERHNELISHPLVYFFPESVMIVKLIDPRSV